MCKMFAQSCHICITMIIKLNYDDKLEYIGCLLIVIKILRLCPGLKYLHFYFSLPGTRTIWSRNKRLSKVWFESSQTNFLTSCELIVGVLFIMQTPADSYDIISRLWIVGGHLTCLLSLKYKLEYGLGHLEGFSCNSVTYISLFDWKYMSVFFAM